MACQGNFWPEHSFHVMPKTEKPLKLQAFFMLFSRLLWYARCAQNYASGSWPRWLIRSTVWEIVQKIDGYRVVQLISNFFKN